MQHSRVPMGIRPIIFVQREGAKGLGGGHGTVENKKKYPTERKEEVKLLRKELKKARASGHQKEQGKSKRHQTKISLVGLGQRRSLVKGRPQGGKIAKKADTTSSRTDREGRVVAGGGKGGT